MQSPGRSRARSAAWARKQPARSVFVRSSGTMHTRVPVTRVRVAVVVLSPLSQAPRAATRTTAASVATAVDLTGGTPGSKVVGDQPLSSPESSGALVDEADGVHLPDRDADHRHAVGDVGDAEA